MESISLITLCIIIFLASIIGGMIGGSFLIILPAMMFFGMNAHEAIGTSKLYMIALGLSSIIYYKHHDIKLKSSLLFIIALIIGVILGSFTVIKIPENILKIIIAVLMIIVVSVILLEKKIGIKEKKIKLTKTRELLEIIVGLIIGFYYGFYGAAASIFVIMAFVLLLGRTFIEGVGNARLMDLVAGFTGLFVFNKFGIINYNIGIPTALASLIGALIGAEIAIKEGNRWLRKLLFGVTIIFVIKLLFF